MKRPPSVNSGATTTTGSNSTLSGAEGDNPNVIQQQTGENPPTHTPVSSDPARNNAAFDQHSTGSSQDDDPHGGLKRVGSRSNLDEKRSRGVVSEGGSAALVELLRSKQKCIRRQSELLSCPSQNASPKRLAYLNSFIKDLQWCFSELSHTQQEVVDMATVEHIAIFLDRSLTRESRRYHNVAHAYNVSAGASPLQVLAAFFRDTVKESIDSCDPEQEMYWKDIFDTEGTHMIRSDVTEDYERIVLHMFGHSQGKELEGPSLDMFLSALVAARLLKDILSLKNIAQVCACIEATIPFRSKGSKHLETLHKRLVSCNKEFHLSLTQKEMEITVQQACDLWNRQVGNMTSKDVAVFLDHTWSLLPEHAKALRKTALYTLSEYHSALIGMDHFMSDLVGREGEKERFPKPLYNHRHRNRSKQVFLEFRGIPTVAERDGFCERFHQNASMAMSYVRARLLSVAVVSAMAILTGGDGPKSYFFGDVPSLNKSSVNLGEILELPTKQDSSCNREVLDLLTRGDARLMDAGFDIRNTGVAAFLYIHLGEHGLQRLVGICQESPITPESSMQLLLALPLSEVVEPILSAFCFMAVTRAPAAERLLSDLRTQKALLPLLEEQDRLGTIREVSTDHSSGVASHNEASEAGVHRLRVFRRMRQAMDRRWHHHRQHASAPEPHTPQTTES